MRRVEDVHLKERLEPLGFAEREELVDSERRRLAFSEVAHNLATRDERTDCELPVPGVDEGASGET